MSISGKINGFWGRIKRYWTDDPYMTLKGGRISIDIISTDNWEIYYKYLQVQLIFSVEKGHIPKEMENIGDVDGKKTGQHRGKLNDFHGMAKYRNRRGQYGLQVQNHEGYRYQSETQGREDNLSSSLRGKERGMQLLKMIIQYFFLHVHKGIIHPVLHLNLYQPKDRTAPPPPPFPWLPRERLPLYRFAHIRI